LKQLQDLEERLRGASQELQGAAAQLQREKDRHAATAAAAEAAAASAAADRAREEQDFIAAMAAKVSCKLSATLIMSAVVFV
jgi:hypothetical protein